MYLLRNTESSLLVLVLISSHFELGQFEGAFIRSEGDLTCLLLFFSIEVLHPINGICLLRSQKQRQQTIISSTESYKSKMNIAQLNV